MKRDKRKRQPRMFVMLSLTQSEISKLFARMVNKPLTIRNEYRVKKSLRVNSEAPSIRYLMLIEPQVDVAKELVRPTDADGPVKGSLPSGSEDTYILKRSCVSFWF